MTRRHRPADNDVPDRYVLFELDVHEARPGGHGDVPPPAVTRGVSATG